MAAPLTPPPLQGPTAKEKKYDRQLRLWAASGQQALEEAHILLINSGSGVAGIETLKNLVLPGIGAFTIVDESAVDEQDLGANFFLEQESLGKSRAAECCRLLRELNPEVKGDAIQKAPYDFISNTDISKYSLIIVIAPIQQEKVLKPLASAAQKHSIPLFYVHSVGFYSRFAIQLPAYFPIVETHPDPLSTQDLRVMKPWNGLRDLMRQQTHKLEEMSDDDHGHVPYLMLLLYYLEKWKEAHNDTLPSTYKEKTEFRALVSAGARTANPEGGEENYDEAAAAVLKTLNPPAVPSSVREIFALPEVQTPVADSSAFFIIAHALAAFVEAEGALPVPGAVPDMKARSADYIELQNRYRAKALADVKAVTKTVRETEARLGRTMAPVEDREIEAFCKGAAWVKLLRGRELRVAGGEGSVDWAGREKMVARELQDAGSLMALNVALMALDAALEGSGVDASSAQEVLKACDDAGFEGRFKTLTEGILKDVLKDEAEEDVEEALGRMEKLRKEILRTGPVEMHNISALTGGMVAQEVIKVVTKQYVPVDNTCVFDGIGSKAGVFRL